MVVGGQQIRKLSGRQQNGMLKSATKKPFELQRDILRVVNETANLERDPQMAAFGMTISSRMLEVRAFCLRICWIRKMPVCYDTSIAEGCTSLGHKDL